MPVDYVVTGCREELDDMREKLLESERHECEDSFAGVMDYEGDPVYIVNKAHFFGMFGVNEGVEELGDFYIANSECVNETPFPLEETEDGTLYFKWTFGHWGVIRQSCAR